LDQEAEQKEKINKRGKAKYKLVIGILLIIAASITIILSTNKDKQTKTVNTPSVIEEKFKKEGEVAFIKKDGKQILTIDVEIADNDQEREIGLMGRNELGELQGMLFIFDAEHIASFWMKNTVLPLDMIFVNKDGVIVTIHKYTTPFSEQAYRATAPTMFVIEVNAGFTDKYGIKIGDRIEWRRI